MGIEPGTLRGHGGRDPHELATDAPKDAVEGLIEQLHGDVIAILPASRLEPALRRLQVLRSALDGRLRIVCCETDLSPLAAGALVRLAASAGAAAPSAALLADALPALERELLVAAVLPGVARLRDPKPSFGARMRSLLPGARFLVSREPEPLVVPLHGRRTPPILVEDPGDEVAVIAAGRVRGTSAREIFQAAFDGAELDEVEAPAGLGGYWHATQAIEAIAYPTDAEAMARRVLSLPAAHCPWCGELHAALPCSLCGHDRDRALPRKELAA